MSRIYFGSKIKTTDSIKLEFPNKELVCSNNTEAQVKSYSRFFDSNKIFLHDNPSNDDIKIIADQVNKNYGIHFMFFDDESYDGRNSFVQSIKKQSSIYDYSYPVLGDEQSLKRQTINYLRSINKDINFECFDWLYKFCPVIRIKSKKTGVKKEMICYDTDILFKELEKISTIKSCIELSDFEQSHFNSDGDIFLLFDYIFSKKLSESLDLSEKLMNSMGDQAILLIFMSQLLFSMSVSSCKEHNIYNAEEVQSIAEFKDLLGKFYDENWIEPSFTSKSQNPIRVKIEISKQSIPTEKISKMIQIVFNCIKDLRNFGDSKLALFLCINKLVSV